MRSVAGKLIASGALLAGLGMPGVNAADSSAVAQDGSPVELVFTAKVDKEPLLCGKTYRSIGKTHAAIFIQDFRIYVSAIRLISQDGNEVPVTLTPDAVWQSDRVALLDFENAAGNCNGNAAMNDRVRASAPAGEYRGVVFEIGVPFEQNHQDPTLAAAPLNYSALTWPWSIGYKFTTIDFDTAPTKRGAAPVTMAAPAHGAPAVGKNAPGTRMSSMSMHGASHSATGFSIHLGSMECASKGPRVPPAVPCGSPNRPTYRFDSFDPHKQQLVMDLASLLAGTDVTVNTPGSPSGCMSAATDDDCVDIMNRLGLAFRGRPSSGQQFIRVEAR